MRFILMIFVLASPSVAQVRPKRATPIGRGSAERLGQTCEQILAMSSGDWVAKFTGERGASPADTIRALGVYGKCYDARTDQLASRLARTGKGPLMGARGNFQNVEQALKLFTTKALADSQPPASPAKAAYAALYEKQFRYHFYEGYEPMPIAPAAASHNESAPSTPSGSSGGPGSAASAGDSTTDRAKRNSAPPTAAKSEEIDPLTTAKNRFGALLGDLPDAQMHDLHESFGEILGPNSATPEMQLSIYRYAIFLLEPPGGTPFSPAPF